MKTTITIISNNRFALSSLKDSENRIKCFNCNLVLFIQELKLLSSLYCSIIGVVHVPVSRIVFGKLCNFCNVQGYS